MTENTDPIRGERVIAAIDMPSTDDGGQLVPLALGTRNGVVKRWNRESPTTMDSWSVIDLKDDDEVLAAAEARDEDRLVFVSTDSSLLTFEAKNVRPQGAVPLAAWRAFVWLRGVRWPRSRWCLTAR